MYYQIQGEAQLRFDERTGKRRNRRPANQYSVARKAARIRNSI